MTGQELANTIVQRRGSTRFGVTGSWNGGNPTNDWGQCTAVPHDVEIVLFGRVLTYGHAKDMFNNAPVGQYHKLAGNVEILPGDIVVQGGDPVLGTDYRYGHIFMATQRSVPGQGITGYSQNYPTGREPHYRTFPRNGLIGALRAKVLSSGGGVTVDPQLAIKSEYLGMLLYLHFLQRPGSRDENRLRMHLGGHETYAAVAYDPAVRERLTAMLVDFYNRLLGRKYLGVPINIALEIKPRVDSIIAGQSAPYQHFVNIATSPEAIAWENTLQSGLKGTDAVALQKLSTAKELAKQGKVPLDKIINEL
jgi:hypothetical protein